VLLALFRQPNANIIETVDRVRALLPNLRAWEPRVRNIMIAIPFDDL
jgi:multidrug efflux pump